MGAMTPLAWAALPTAVFSQNLGSPAPLDALRIFIPGGAGGGWDQTGRSLGEALVQAGMARSVVYENKGGKGGTTGLAEFVQRFNTDPSALFIGGMVLVGAISVNRPAVNLKQVVPLARLTSDYMVLVVPAQSPFASVASLADAMRKDLGSIVFTGGSIGGVDHMLAAMMARQLRLNVADLQYSPTSSGQDAVALLQAGKAQVAISSYSEFQEQLDAKVLRGLAVSSRKSLFGMPSLQESGIRTEMANWRGVFGPGGVSPEQSLAMEARLALAVQTPTWKAALANNRWNAAWALGKDFRDALPVEQGIADVVTMMLKIKAP